MHLPVAIPWGGGGGGGNSGDIPGNSVGFANFYSQFLSRDGGSGPLLHFRGKKHRERPAGLLFSI